MHEAILKRERERWREREREREKEREREMRGPIRVCHMANEFIILSVKQF